MQRFPAARGGPVAVPKQASRWQYTYIRRCHRYRPNSQLGQAKCVLAHWKLPGLQDGHCTPGYSVKTPAEWPHQPSVLLFQLKHR